MPRATDIYNGFLNGFLSMFGAGEANDAMGDLTSELKGIQQETQSLTNANSLAFAGDIITTLNTLRDLNQLTSKEQQQLHENTNTFINDSLQKENLFILFLYLLIFILIFFFLIQKNCCKE